MAEEKQYGSVKRFGARYGRSIRDKIAQVEAILRAKKKCPYCHSLNVVRKSAGIWHCTKCKKTFAGRAYTIVEQLQFKADNIDDQIKMKSTKKAASKSRKSKKEEAQPDGQV